MKYWKYLCCHVKARCRGCWPSEAGAQLHRSRHSWGEGSFLEQCGRLSKWCCSHRPDSFVGTDAMFSPLCRLATLPGPSWPLPRKALRQTLRIPCCRPDWTCPCHTLPTTNSFQLDFLINERNNMSEAMLLCRAWIGLYYGLIFFFSKFCQKEISVIKVIIVNLNFLIWSPYENILRY